MELIEKWLLQLLLRNIVVELFSLALLRIISVVINLNVCCCVTRSEALLRLLIQLD